MISRNNNTISKFVVVLSVIVFIEIINFIMNIYLNANDTLGTNVIDMLYFVKFLSILTLFISLLIWTRNKDKNILKVQVVVHTLFVFAISVFYFLILYLFKYSIVLDVMDILRNKMIEGNPALLLNFSVYSYNTLKYIKGTFGSFNSELILMIELLFITWQLRNVMSVETVEEENVSYDSFLYNNNLKYFSGALIVFSFLSINLFSYTFDTLGAIMFLVTFLLFSLQLPCFYFIRRISNSSRKKSTKSSFLVFHNLSLILGIISIVGFIIGLALNMYASEIGIGTYRIYSIVISLCISSYITFKIYKTKTFI